MTTSVGKSVLGTLAWVIFPVAGIGLLYLASAYVGGIQYQMSGFYGDFAQLVNRNLLAPWEPGEEFRIRAGKWCAPGIGPDWPRTRSQCAFVGGAVDGCSIFTYGRSCAVIGVPRIYFDDQHFRESLRIALTNLCAVFPLGTQYRLRRPSLYDSLGCTDGRGASLAVYIHVSNSVVEPPYTIRIPPLVAPKRVALAYFSAWTKQISLISEVPK